MSKDFKEKYSRICGIKERAIGLIEMGMAQDVKDINSKELYELMDIIKDCEESIKLAEEAEYYCSVTEAMEDATDSEKKYYTDKYIPETAMYYTPINSARHNIRMYTDPIWHDDIQPSYKDRMYYSSMTNNTSSNPNISRMNYSDDNLHQINDGKSYISRRNYMDARDKGDTNKKSKELENYMHDLTDDLNEMLENLDTNEKAVVRQKIAQLANKI